MGFGREEGMGWDLILRGMLGEERKKERMLDSF